MITMADSPNPYKKPDDTWISLSGKVATVSPDTFKLDYGDGLVTVEMDDWDMDNDAYKLIEDDKVVVNGIVDDDMFETTSIEASSVYVENIGTYFYANPDDEEDMSVTVSTPIVTSRTIVQGTVSDIDGREIRLNTGDRLITVDTDELGYNPLDNAGYQQIEEGDRISAYGYVDNEFFDGRVIDALSLVTLEE
ncbi:hypothetical protein DDZ13_03555 [Coraliomargarita sinensis]|uniref:DUF5666 domain-containing protein n=2 Tax=Coraliomargarita sinensis TaxID=2174842 RepID=A0A317ZLF1_9BACT|nr:hypothetical protein DDZ13_03555 [Coraliomargarita sinensis]